MLVDLINRISQIASEA